MNILFIHQNFPGQFRSIAEHLASDPTNTVLALRQNRFPVDVKGVDIITYRFVNRPQRAQHPMLGEMEAKVLRAEAVADACLRLKKRGWSPELIVAHPGWGEALLIKELFPKARFVCYAEYFYAQIGQDHNFDSEFLDFSITTAAKLKLKNTATLQALHEADAIWTATQWQRSTFPQWAQPRINVIHEGVDLDIFKPNPGAAFTISGKGITLSTKDQVITFACRSLEPARGFHTFMRALPAVLKAFPKAHVVLMGGHAATYGTEPKTHKTWLEKMLSEVGAQLDPKRVHVVGFLPKEVYRTVLQVSKAHVYYTYPFILSWSVIEAMACGAQIVGSRTAPVLEIMGGKSDAPYCFDFFSTKELIGALKAALKLSARQRLENTAKTRKRLEKDFSTKTQINALMPLLGVSDKPAETPARKSIVSTKRRVTSGTKTKSAIRKIKTSTAQQLVIKKPSTPKSSTKKATKRR